jgi:thiamine biosynthesis lipoprotein
VSNYLNISKKVLSRHRLRAICGLTLVLLGITLLLAGCEQQPYLLEQRILQFGTVIDITLIHHDLAKSEQALIEIEQQLSAYRQSWHGWEDSDLSRFNQALSSAQAVAIPASLLELIILSQQYYLRSNRLFNPALGKLFGAYGFHGQSDPDKKLIKIIQQDLPTMLDLEIQDQLATSQNAHLQLDFGGIAKGYAVGLIAGYLEQQGFEHFLINAGGDLITSGSKLGKPWHIGVQNPFEPGAIYISSASVLTSDPVLADVAATTLMIDGVDNHRSLAHSLGIEDYMIIDEDQKIIISRSLSEKIQLAPGLTATIID